MKVITHLGSKLSGRVRQVTREGGFTLIELLVVVAILGALAAVAVPSVSKFAGRGQTESKNTELQNVQTATDALMADLKLSAVTASTASAAATTDFSTFDLDPGAGTANLYPGYMRQQLAMSAVGYCWTSTGQVSQKTMPGGTC